jgi:hypothetical protein
MKIVRVGISVGFPGSRAQTRKLPAARKYGHLRNIFPAMPIFANDPRIALRKIYID